jgi:HWE histidine kinase
MTTGAADRFSLSITLSDAVRLHVILPSNARRSIIASTQCFETRRPIMGSTPGTVKEVPLKPLGLGGSTFYGPRPPRSTGYRYSADIAFSTRISGLANANDLLVSRQWVGTDPASLVRSQLTPFTEIDGSRVKTEVPKVTPRPQAAEALGLALHELATNGRQSSRNQDEGIGCGTSLWQRGSR